MRGCANFEFKIPVPQSAALAAKIRVSLVLCPPPNFLMHAWRESGTNFVLVDAEIYVMFEPDHIFDACTWTCQIESESSLPRAADRAEEGSKIGLRSDLRASNLKNFPWGAKELLHAFARSHILSRTNSILLLPGLYTPHISHSESSVYGPLCRYQN